MKPKQDDVPRTCKGLGLEQLSIVSWKESGEMKKAGLKVIEIGPDSAEDIEALLFENFLALVQTVRDGNKVEIIVHYQQKEVQNFEQPKLLFREKRA